MRILVVGAGSTGGYYGARLAQAGRDVTFLVRPARAERLRADGLRIVSPHGDVTVRPQLVTAGQIAAPFDAVLLTVKAFSLGAALADVAPAVGPESMIVPVLNGMRHMEVIADRFGSAVLVGGVAKIATTLDEQGRIIQLNPLHDLAYGEISGEATARIRRLDAAMQGAGFDAKLSPTIEREMWEKWVMLAGLGAATCLMRGTIGEIAAANGGADFVHALLGECVATVTAAGHPPSEAFLAAARTQLTAAGSPMTSSMYRDLVKGSAVEADQILGDLLARAKGFGVSAPNLAAAVSQLSVYQNRIAAQAAS
jgi:2-dehydropantoate 2-reductase